MKFRVNEGDGEAFYYIGVEDDGKFSGITEDEYNKTFDNLKIMADKNKFTLQLLSSKEVDKYRKIYEFLVREINTSKYTEVKICVAGNVDSGKSSLLGVLFNTGLILNSSIISLTFIKEPLPLDLFSPKLILSITL